MKKQIISLFAAIIFLYTPYLWCKLTNDDSEKFGLYYSTEKKDIAYTLIVTMVVLILLTVIALNWPWEKLPKHRSLSEILNIGLSGISAAIIEETFFRGFIQSLLEKKFSAYIAIIITNLIFAPIHLIVSPYWISLLTFFPGLIMGWLKFKFKNLLPPTLFHLLGNIWAIWFFPLPVISSEPICRFCKLCESLSLFIKF